MERTRNPFLLVVDTIRVVDIGLLLNGIAMGIVMIVVQEGDVCMVVLVL